MIGARDTCEITADGYLRLPAALAERHFPASVCVATVDGDDLVLLPLRSEANGGLVLKQRNLAGDRSVLISEVLAFRPPAGRFDVRWQADRGALLIALRERRGEGVGGDPDIADGGRRGLSPVGRVPAGDRRGGRHTSQALGAPQRARGEADGIRRAAGGAPAPETPTGGRARQRVAP